MYDIYRSHVDYLAVLLTLVVVKHVDSTPIQMIDSATIQRRFNNPNRDMNRRFF